eukprot:3462467-Rhodomonas_salina.4
MCVTHETAARIVGSAMSGPHGEYGTTYKRRVWGYAVSGTDAGYGATQLAVPAQPPTREALCRLVAGIGKALKGVAAAGHVPYCLRPRSTDWAYEAETWCYAERGTGVLYRKRKVLCVAWYWRAVRQHKVLCVAWY